MKIVSLQSVGLGTYFQAFQDKEVAYSPTIYKVGEEMEKVGYIANGNEPEVARIEYNSVTYKDGSGLNRENTYQVRTSDGHIRVLPADNYIAEWAE